jgi:His-Xaa-Ser system protein HxsD
MDAVVKKQDGVLEVRLAKAIYEKEAVLAALYEISGKCRPEMRPEPEGYVTVTLGPLASQPDLNLEEVENQFLSALVDQQLRLDLEKRHGPLRLLIVRHAFAPLEHLEDEVKHIVGRK